MSKTNTTTVSTGVSLGSLLAVLLSWSTNHSILYCILHACCSWAYVVYWVIVYSK